MVAIAAVDENWGIGYRGRLLVRISADLRRFKELTLGRAVILGRKTLDTFPGGRPLPGRENLILSRTLKEAPAGAAVFRDVDSLLARAPADSVVIGGQSVYKALLPYCDEAYITRILRVFPADAWFPDLDRAPGWTLAEREEPLEEAGVTFQYLRYQRGERW